MTTGNGFGSASAKFKVIADENIGRWSIWRVGATLLHYCSAQFGPRNVNHQLDTSDLYTWSFWMSISITLW